MTFCEHKPGFVVRGHTGPAGVVASPRVGARARDLRVFGADTEAWTVLMVENRRLLGWKLPLGKQHTGTRCSGKRKPPWRSKYLSRTRDMTLEKAVLGDVPDFHVGPLATCPDAVYQSHPRPVPKSSQHNLHKHSRYPSGTPKPLHGSWRKTCPTAKTSSSNLSTHSLFTSTHYVASVLSTDHRSLSDIAGLIAQLHGR